MRLFVYVSPEGDLYEKDGAEFEAAADELLNSTVFAAAYFKQGFSWIEFFFLWSYTSSLESDWHADVHEDAKIPSVYARQAAIWMLLVGREIFAYCQNNHGRRKPNTNHHVFALWRGDQGYSLERWTLWKKRFSELAQMNEEDARTKDMASKALAEMEKIENED